ncbi:hypothetical protein BGX28_000077 [Mortierella sp. GBA30]|nr:hypothetical protein BGX28_000077 [Mortierella sp. GBA30]
MAVLVATTPASVQGLPQPSDNFSRRFRNRSPVVIRQIIPQIVLDQWSSDPEHVINALNRSVYEHQQQPTVKDEEEVGCSEKQENVIPADAEAEASTVSLPCLGTKDDPHLPVMVAEDTKNFMDNPQFTKKITMTAREIAARVFPPRSESPALPSFRIETGSDIEETEHLEDIVPDLLVQGTRKEVLPASNCALCDNQVNDLANDELYRQSSIHTSQSHDNNSDDNSLNHLRRFYYRGMVPSSLYSALQIPDLLSSLSLPTETTAFANAPNKDLMRIWISLAGATTPLHYDRCHGILIQLVGRKRFVVFSHEDTNGLYPYDGISGPGHASKVRGLAHCFPFVTKTSIIPKTIITSTSSSSAVPATLPGSESTLSLEAHLQLNKAEILERWPKIKNTTPWVVDLEPGDALYTPPGFWHEVTSIDHSISITVPWDMDANELEHVPRHMAF